MVGKEGGGGTWLICKCWFSCAVTDKAQSSSSSQTAMLLGIFRASAFNVKKEINDHGCQGGTVKICWLENMEIRVKRIQ